MSTSGRPIQYAPATDIPHIGYNAPSAADILKGKPIKRRIGTSSKKTTKKIKVTTTEAQLMADLLVGAVRDANLQLPTITGIGLSYYFNYFSSFFIIESDFDTSCRANT